MEDQVDGNHETSLTIDARSGLRYHGENADKQERDANQHDTGEVDGSSPHTTE